MKIVSAKLTGGLGNQLFQIFSAFSVSFDRGLILQILELDEAPSCTKRYTYWNTFLKKMKSGGYLTSDKTSINRLPVLHSMKNIPKNKTEFILYGENQNYHNFHHYTERIRQLIGIDDTVVDYEFSENISYISLHFRLGDYKKYSHIHPLLPITYYENAIKYICEKEPKEKEILVFGELQDEALVNEKINHLKNIFPEIKFISIINLKLNDYEEMILMSMCHHNIIANSTFSWWGAYLNKNKDQIVCYPNKWINVHHDLECLPEWTKLD